MGKFFAVFGLIILHMIIGGAFFAGIVALIGWFVNFQEEIMVGSGIAAGVLFFVTFPIALNVMIKQVYHFEGTGTPIPIEELKSEILAINNYDAPVMVEEKKNKLIVTWNYLDAKWWELLAKRGKQQTYELHIKFDKKRDYVKLIDVTRSVEWRAGPDSVKFGWSGFRGVQMRYEIGKAWGIKENFELGKIYDYRFVTSEIKNPVMNTILRNGWDVRFAMW